MTVTTEPVEKAEAEAPAETYIEDGGIHAQLAPWAAMGALTLAAGAVRLAGSVGGHEQDVALGTAATAFVVAVVAACVAGRRFVDRKDRSRALAAISLAAGWVSWTVATGVSMGAVCALVVMGWGVSQHWWDQHRIPNAPATTGGEPTGDQYVTRWARHLGGSGDILPKSWLHAPEEISAGLRYRLELVPGRQTLADVMGNLENVRGGLRLRQEDEIIVERHPVFAAPCLQLTIVTRSPIRHVLPWPGPGAFDSETGRVTLGPFSDGEGSASWRAMSKDSAWGGFICGGSGSGKSRTIESICMALASAGVVVWFADGQNGASSALLKRKADHFAGTVEQWSEMFDQALEVMQIRQDENDVEDRDGFTHTRKRPMLMVVVDECHKVFADPELQRKAATIAREGRKVGVVILAASQVNDLSAFGTKGEAETLRSSLLMGNGIIMRTKANSAKGIFGVAIDPRQFPKIPGYGFLVDPDDDERSAPYRGWYVTDDVAKTWADRIAWATLDATAAGAAGPDYTERHSRRELARQLRRERVEAARAGRLVRERTCGPVVTRTVPAVPQFTPLRFPTWDPASFRPAAPSLSSGHRQVAAALQDGRGLVAGQRYCKPSTMAAEVGLTERRVHTILKDLIRRGVVRVGDTQGHYYPTGKTLAETAA